MKLNKQFLSLLRCPKTSQPLSLRQQQLVNSDKSEHYPIINEIPWLLKNPLHSMVDWSVKLNHFNQIFSDEIHLLDNQIKRNSISSTRLKKLQQGKKDFQKQVSNLVSPILSAKVASKPVYDALSDRAPNTQNLLSYESNLYRDWVWGEDENQLTCSLVQSLIQKKAINNLLVLGAGSCKLTYDLHQSLSPELTVANDINPLLLFSAKEILFHNGLELEEFPPQPRNSEHVVLSHRILPVKVAPDNFYLLFSDAVTPALKENAFDTIITPWLIDIQPFELKTFMCSINQYLTIGGEWINFGSLVFNQDREALCYTLEEIKVLAQRSGFLIEETQENEIPYLKSPYNAGYRIERVTSWRAIKKDNVTIKKEHQVLPDWILDTQKIIPKTREFQSFTFNHSLYAELSGQVDGKRSIKKIAQQLAKEKSMDINEAESMVKNFYLKIIQQQV